MRNRSFWLGLLAYVIVTFAIAFTWHLVLFEAYYQSLKIYRENIILPFGPLSMLIQGAVFSWAYPRLMTERGGAWLAPGLKFGLIAGLLSWSFTTIAVAAKHPMTSVPDFMLIETAFTAVQFVFAGPLIALVHRRSDVLATPGLSKTLLNS